MATTTNYGWTTPDDTDLVKDGAAAIRTLGSSVDTTTKALNPSTTEGDIEYRSATANTNSRLAIGTAGQVLTVNSGADAPEWATPASTNIAKAVGLYKSGTQAITNATFTALTFDSEDYDTDAFHSTVTNTSRITIPAGLGGYYQINASARFQDNTSGVRIVSVYKNGSLWSRITNSAPAGAGSANPTLPIIMSLAASDYIEFFVYQNSGGSLDVYGNSIEARGTSFTVAYLGA